MEISSNFVAFSENLNLNFNICSILIRYFQFTYINHYFQLKLFLRYKGEQDSQIWMPDIWRFLGSRWYREL